MKELGVNNGTANANDGEAAEKKKKKKKAKKAE